MVVEPDDAVRTLFVEWCAEYGRAVGATTVEEALSTPGTFDAVFTERRLPDGTSRTLGRRLRERNRECYVALVTSTRPRRDAPDLPLDDYLRKPVSKRDIRLALERAVE